MTYPIGSWIRLNSGSPLLWVADHMLVRGETYVVYQWMDGEKIETAISPEICYHLHPLPVPVTEIR